MIVFTTGCFDELKVLIDPCKTSTGAKVIVVDELTNANKLRSYVSQETTGIYLIDRKFYRGFDLKLASDANVVVLDTAQNLLWSEAK